MRDKITMNTKYWRLKIQSFTRPEEKPHNFHGCDVDAFTTTIFN